MCLQWWRHILQETLGDVVNCRINVYITDECVLVRL